MSPIFHYRELLRNLVLKDLKIKYRDSAIGFLWSLVNPLLLILVYSFVFSHILKVDIANFSFFLMVGILPWNFFSQSIMLSTGSFLDNGGLIRKVAMPMEIFPLSTVLFTLVQFGLALLVFLPMTLFFFDVRIGWVTLWFFPVLLLQLLFTVGLSFMIATATVFYRDVRHFMEIALMLLFWLTPIIYDVKSIPATLRTAIYLNPQTFFILSYQDVLYRQSAPDWQRLAIMAGLAATSLWLGWRVTSSFKAQFAEEI